MGDFCHLHNHTSYSLLDGAAKIPEFLDGVAADGQRAAGITDHGHMNGVVDFYKEAKKRDLTPVLGTELYFTDDRNVREKGVKRYHLTLLAETTEGYHNLSKISSDAFLNGFYGKPRGDWESLAAHSKGVIATTGCLGGPVLQRLLERDVKGAVEQAARLQDIFGKESLFVEIMNHGIPEQTQTNPLLLHVAKQIDAPLLVTNDCHYTKAADAIPHDILLCCQTGARKADKDRFRFDSDQHYLKTAEEMRYLFREVESGCDNTLWIAERAQGVELGFGEIHLPNFPLPDGYADDSAYLEHLVMEALPNKYGTPLSEEVLERAKYELQVIKDLHLSSYFLIFWDLAAFARRERIMTGPGRGSAAGSIVSYALGVTKLDPLKHGLIFERFINPDRIALADIDWDIDTRYREKLINYSKEKYGDDHVAQIITFGQIKARTAVRDAAKVLGYDWAMGDKIAKLMPPLIMGVDTPLYACFKEEDEFKAGYKNAQGLRDLYNADGSVKQIVDAALGIEGLHKSHGVHAAGVVIGDRPLVELLPLQLAGDEEGERQIVTQYEKNTIEDLGLLKMDFLGLRNLDVIADTLDLLGFPIDFFDNLESMDDPGVFELLQQGNTIGIFQVESPQMRALLKRMKPTNTDDISAVLALYRPGPMAANMHNDYADRKNGRQNAVPFHEDAAEILGETFQLAVYQEQVMRVSRKFAGYTFAEADNLRKIMGKKLPEKMRAEKSKFVQGCVNTGYSQEFADQLFHLIEGFASYGFNKSHSYAYGYITYWTAYLKVHHPKEYMASLCTSVMKDHSKTALYLSEARRMGLKVQAPDVNVSQSEFTVTEDGIMVGLTLLRDVGRDLADRIVSEAPYTGLRDFCARIMPTTTVMKSLAAGGALDAFGTRLGIATVSDNILTSIRKQRKKVSADQVSLFDAADIAIADIEVPTVEYGWQELLDKEKEALGLYLSGHPLDEFTDEVTDTTLADLREIEPGGKEVYEVLVSVMACEVKWTRKGDAMAILQVEDVTGGIEVVVFPNKWTHNKPRLQEGAVVKIKVRVSTNNRDERNYILDSVDLLRGTAERRMVSDRKIMFHLPRGFHSDQKFMSKLKGIFLTHRGDVPVSVYISRSSQADLKNDYLVQPSQTLRDEVKNLYLEFAKSRES